MTSKKANALQCSSEGRNLTAEAVLVADKRFKPMPEGAPDVAKYLASNGATEYEIADALDVDISTLRRWANVHEGMNLSLKVAFDAATDRVERSLFMRATGYEYQAEKVFKLKDKIDGNYVERLESKTVTIRIDPDTTAAIYWLKSRRRNDWAGDRQPGDAPDNPMHIQIDAVRTMLAQARLVKRAPITIEQDDDDDIVGSKGD